MKIRVDTIMAARGASSLQLQVLQCVSRYDLQQLQRVARGALDAANSMLRDGPPPAVLQLQRVARDAANSMLMPDEYDLQQLQRVARDIERSEANVLEDKALLAKIRKIKPGGMRQAPALYGSSPVREKSIPVKPKAGRPPIDDSEYVAQGAELLRNGFVKDYTEAAIMAVGRDDLCGYDRDIKRISEKISKAVNN